MKIFPVCLTILWSLLLTSSHAQTLLDQWFWPLPDFPGNAELSDLATVPAPPIQWRLTDPMPPVTLLHGEQPTDRIPFLLRDEELPDKTFTLEMWVLDHVNQPVGATLVIADAVHPGQPILALGYHHHSAFVTGQGLARPLQTDVFRGFQQYFYHLGLTGDGDSLRLFLNGVKMSSVAQPEWELPEEAHLGLEGYFAHEPWMKTGHLVKHVRVSDRLLSQEEIKARYTELCIQVEAGHRLPASEFHLTAGPYLFTPTQHSIDLLWETSQPATATLRYGTVANHMDHEQTVACPEGIGHVEIGGLGAGQRYFYELSWENEAGEILNSGVLSFATAVEDSAAWSFAVCGDPEARPHVNQRLSELVWEERPNFLLNLGDLTDGGKAPHRFEWTYEYFTGMGPLHHRIPVFPVAGNGESDLVWYRHYHGQSVDAPAYYTFTYGNAQFFILDSNQKDELEPGGRQYEWLEAELAASTATWKFVGHHHAPFTSDEDDYGDTWKDGTTALGDLKVRELVPLYERYGVDIVFFGHLHTYERTWPIRDLKVDPEFGVVYLVSGGAGGNLEDFSPTRSWFTTKLYRGHHYSRIDIFQDKLYFKMYDLHGALKDYMELVK